MINFNYYRNSDHILLTFNGTPKSDFKISKELGPDFTQLIFYPDKTIFESFSPDKEELLSWLKRVKEKYSELKINLQFHEQKISM